MPVRDFSFSLEPGEILGLSGPSGCGKTVLCTALLGMLEAPGYVKSGSVLYCSPRESPAAEIDLLKLSEKEWRLLRGGEISLIFQNPVQALNPSRTAGAQFIEALRVRRPNIRPPSRRQAEETALSLLADTGLPDPRRVMESYPFELSGGMCQRVLIAMVLARRPALLIADEPTTSLDKKNEAQILGLFRKIRDTGRTGVLLVSHDGDVIKTADRIIRME
jgi:ABC-type dipeptide/oligopeptide/nickel transport system ATPase component